MTNRFREMVCYVLAGNRPRQDHFTGKESEPDDLAPLERSYRRYAKLFDRVVLVLKSDQARDKYLNYPHVCDDGVACHPAVGVAAALRNAPGEAVFIGSADISDFPLDLAANLVRQYKGEAFLGYQSAADSQSKRQPWFGIYSRSLTQDLDDDTAAFPEALEKTLRARGRFIDLPADTPAGTIGLD